MTVKVLNLSTHRCIYIYIHNQNFKNFSLNLFQFLKDKLVSLLFLVHYISWAHMNNF